MAKYRVTNSKGESFVITGGDTPPTQELIQELMNGINGYKEPAKAPVLTPLSDDMKAKPRDTDYAGIIGQGALGFGQGVLSGLGRVASGASLGATDWLDRKLGGNLKRLDENLQRSAEQSGLGGLNKVAKFTAELGGNIKGGGGILAKKLLGTNLRGLKLASATGGLEGAAYGLTGSDKLKDVPKNVAINSLAGATMGGVMPIALKPLNRITNKLNNYIGKKQLAKELHKTDNYNNVFLGNVDDNVATELNRIRNFEKVAPVENTDVTIPESGVNHIYQSRLVRNKNYNPENLSEVINTALFSKNPRVIRGNVKDNQVIFDKSNPARKVVVSKNKDTNGISIITAMKDKKLGKFNKRLGGLPFPPYEANITSDVAAAADSFKIPDFQPLLTSSDNTIASLSPKVNPFEKRSFIEALADTEKARKIRNGILSGASDLSERAHILQDNLARRKNGWYDADFEELIKTPELAKAEVDYSDFIAKNGQNTLSPEKVQYFYEQHPIAQDIIEEMRGVDPRAFDNIKPGSLSEFDMLKKILREEAGNKIKVGASKSGALKRAENSLKDIMDNEFPGFKDVNKKYAEAHTTQDIFESKLRKGLTSVGGGTANVTPFWSGISSPLTAAGVVGGFLNPSSVLLTAAGLGGKALWRNHRRNVARRIANGVMHTPLIVNPTLINGLSAPALRNLSNKNEE